MNRRHLATILLIFCFSLSAAHPQAGAPRISKFEVSYPASVDPGPITGRVLVIVSKNNRREPRLQAGSYSGSVPFFGVDVGALKAGESAVIDTSTLGYPLNLGELPPGDYYVQAVLNVYTEVHRKDGRTLWVHMDQWEGQEWNTSPEIWLVKSNRFI